MTLNGVIDLRMRFFSPNSIARVVVSVSTSWSRDGVETYQRLVSVSSQEKFSTSRSRLGLERQTSRSRFGLGQLRLVPKTNFRPNCAGNINKKLIRR